MNDTKSRLINPKLLGDLQTTMLLDGPLGILYIQTIDTYGYQRELTLRNRFRGELPSDRPFVVSAYRHPFRPPTEIPLSRVQAQKVLDRLVEITEKYPLLLWNYPNSHIPGRNSGFVHFHDLLLDDSFHSAWELIK